MESSISSFRILEIMGVTDSKNYLNFGFISSNHSIYDDMDCIFFHSIDFSFSNLFPMIFKGVKEILVSKKSFD